MYGHILGSIRQAAKKRNLRERTIHLYCSDVGYFLRCTNKPVADLTFLSPNPGCFPSFPWQVSCRAETF